MLNLQGTFGRRPLFRPVGLFARPLALAALLAACRVAPPATHTGCESDKQCKLNRICEAGRCQWPLSPTMPPTDAGSNAPGNLKGGNVPGSTAQKTGPAPLTGAAQTMFRADAQHRGRSPHRLPKRPPEVVWKYKSGGPINGSPALLADGTVAVGSHDKALHLVDPKGFKRSVFATGDHIFGSPAVDAAGNLYIGSDDDHLYAFDTATLGLKWRKKLGNCAVSRGVGPENSRCDAQGGPTIGPDGMIFVGSNGLYAFSPKGEQKWHFPTGGRIAAAPALLQDGTIVAGAQDNLFYAISPAGEKRWDFRTGGDIESSATIAPDGVIYFGSDDHRIYALTATGDLLWSLQTGADVRASPALGRDDMVVVGSFDGIMYAIMPDGTLAWTFRTGDRIASSALIDAAGAIVFGSQDDRLYCLESDGVLRWSVELPADIDSSPILGPDGTLYVGADDGYLYALTGP